MKESKNSINRWCADRVDEFYTGGQKDGRQLSLLYYDSYDGRAEILFLEEGNLKEWQKLFIYLFDEHGSKTTQNDRTEAFAGEEGATILEQK